MKLKLLVLCLTSFIVIVKSQATEESCIVLNTKRPGICKTIPACEVPNIHLTSPTICDRDLMTICCPISHQKFNRKISIKRISNQS